MGDDVARYVEVALEKGWRANQGVVDRVADCIASAYLGGHRIYAFGSGHSHLLVEEMYYRAGGLTIVTPIWDSALMLHEDAEQSSRLEQTPGYARTIIDRVGWQSGDVLWLISNSGRNPLIVEMALGARKSGLTVVALTSMNHAQAVSARSVTGQKLHEVADLVLDNGGIVGDAGFHITGLAGPIFPTSTIVGAALVNWVWLEVAKRLRDAGHPPDVLTSFNVDTSH